VSMVGDNKITMALGTITKIMAQRWCAKAMYTSRLDFTLDIMYNHARDCTYEAYHERD
jgi:hypothetical protein